MDKSPPETVSLTQEDLSGLTERIADSPLLPQDKKIILAILSMNFWLQNQLSYAKLTVVRLKKIFGLPTEKKTVK